MTRNREFIQRKSENCAKGTRDMNVLKQMFMRYNSQKSKLKD